jgi:hypothetical protein
MVGKLDFSESDMAMAVILSIAPIQGIPCTGHNRPPVFALLFTGATRRGGARLGTALAPGAKLSILPAASPLPIRMT